MSSRRRRSSKRRCWTSPAPSCSSATTAATKACSYGEPWPSFSLYPCTRGLHRPAKRVLSAGSPAEQVGCGHARRPFGAERLGQRGNANGAEGVPEAGRLVPLRAAACRSRFNGCEREWEDGSRVHVHAIHGTNARSASTHTPGSRHGLRVARSSFRREPRSARRQSRADPPGRPAERPGGHRQGECAPRPQRVAVAERTNQGAAASAASNAWSRLTESVEWKPLA